MSEFEKLLAEVEKLTNREKIVKDLAKELDYSVGFRHQTLGEAMVRSDNRYWNFMRSMEWVDFDRGSRALPGGNLIASLTDSNYPCLWFLSEKAIKTHRDLAYEGYYGVIKYLT